MIVRTPPIDAAEEILRVSSDGEDLLILAAKSFWMSTIRKADMSPDYNNQRQLFNFHRSNQSIHQGLLSHAVTVKMN